MANLSESLALTTIRSPLLLRVKEAADLLSISQGLCWQLVWSGQLPSVRLGDKAVRIPRQALEEWINRNMTATPTCQYAD